MITHKDMEVTVGDAFAFAAAPATKRSTQRQNTAESWFKLRRHQAVAVCQVMRGWLKVAASSLPRWVSKST